MGVEKKEKQIKEIYIYAQTEKEEAQTGSVKKEEKYVSVRKEWREEVGVNKAVGGE